MSTPVQRQYWDLKNQNPDHILFFRLGDFYELFFEDAVIGSKVLGITLTARHKGTDNEMPMAGFPYHSHKEYLETLINQGYKVAIAEQIEDDEGKITRQVDQVITPGTTLESGNLEQDKNNFLATIFHNAKKTEFALAYFDLSTGDFRTALFDQEKSWLDEIFKIKPQEILLPESLYQDDAFTEKLPKVLLNPKKFQKILQHKKLLTDALPENHLSVVGLDKLESLMTVCAETLSYIEQTKKSAVKVKKIERYDPRAVMQLDMQTWRHLEIFEPIQNTDESATLWSVLEKPFTAMGGRKLRHWCWEPLLDSAKILKRQRAVSVLNQDYDLSSQLTEHLKQITDLERLLARLVHNKGNARDLVFIRTSLSKIPEIILALETTEDLYLEKLRSDLGDFTALTEVLEKALVEAPPLEITSGGLFALGYHDRLDELKKLSENAQKWLDDFLAKAKAESGISNTRIKFSKNFGFCLEVSKAQSDSVPESWIRRQTLVNAERFTTVELGEYESKVLSAESESFALEHELFLELRESLLTFAPRIQVAAQAIAQLDALLSFSRTAQKNRWVAPEILEDGTIENRSLLEIKQGRHPVVESLSGEAFIPNDLVMSGDASRFHLISGPNMAGKSTFLRQNALIIYLAQIGSFVPAEKVRLSIHDRIFTRVGASDNLAAGKSTFFVEMSEAATILHAATDRSFVILDEIGRGTSTFDGISLAWAITEYMHDKIKCKTLFATHYHELIDLAEDLPQANNFHVSVSQNKSGIIFLRQIKPGGISDSFGIEVAKLAGLPKTVVEDAKEVLRRLESESLLSGKPNLFSLEPSVSVEEARDSVIEGFVENINPDDLSPKEALERWYEIKKLRAE